MIYRQEQLGVSYVPTEIKARMLHERTAIVLPVEEAANLVDAVAGLNRMNRIEGGGAQDFMGVMRCGMTPVEITGRNLPRSGRLEGTVKFFGTGVGNDIAEIRFINSWRGMGRYADLGTVRKAMRTSLNEAKRNGHLYDAVREWDEWTKTFDDMLRLVCQGKELMLFHTADGSDLDYLRILKIKDLGIINKYVGKVADWAWQMFGLQVTEAGTINFDSRQLLPTITKQYRRVNLLNNT